MEKIQHGIGTAACICLLGIMCSACRQQSTVTVSHPVRVKVLDMSAQMSGDMIRYSGTVQEDAATKLSFGLPGTVRSVSVKEGDKVTKGQVLAQLEDNSYRSAYNTAKAMLDQAEDAHERLKKLHDNNALADVKWVEIQSQLTQAQSLVNAAQSELDNCKLVSPVNGTVSVRSIEPGQYVIPGFEALRVIDVSQMNFQINVPENEINSFKKGIEAQVTVQAIEGAKYRATVSKVAATANPLTRTYDVVFTSAEADARLRPGMLCDVSISASVHTEKAMEFIIPAEAVMLTAENTHYVWIAGENGTAERRDITVGRSTATGIVVESGLSEYDKVIVEGMLKVSRGCRIEVLD